MAVNTKRFINSLVYRGTFNSLNQINAITNPIAGDTADLDVGNNYPSIRYTYDTQDGWHQQSTSIINFALNPAPIVGSVPSIVGTLLLQPGVYLPKADFGCGVPTDVPTLEIRTNDGTILTSLGGVPSGLSWKTASQSFTLNVDTNIFLVLYADKPTAISFIRGFKT